MTASDLLSVRAVAFTEAKALRGKASTNASTLAIRNDLTFWALQLSGADADTESRPTWPAVLDLITAADIYDEAVESVLTVNRHLKKSTRKRYLSTLKGFTKYLVKRGVAGATQLDPDIHVGGSETTEVKSLSQDAVARLLVAAATPPDTARSAWPQRDVAVIRLGVECGTRAAETCALRWVDIDDDDPALLRVHRSTKGNRERLVPVGATLLADLADLRTSAVDRGLPSDDQDLVFTKSSGVVFDPRSLSTVLRRCAEAASPPVSFPEGAVFHSLRHTCAAELARRGVPMSVIQAVLGHASLATTGIYTRVNGHELAAQFQDAGLLD